MKRAGKPAPRTPAGGRRLKLSDLETGWYCTIIGTCLGMGELRRLAARQRVVFPMPNPTEMHTGMIRLVSQERAVAKAITKMLDQKHAAAIGRFRRAASAADLEALWRASVEKGEVAGACWALMSHPLATEHLRSEVFGEIHMLSHQVGAAARVDLKRFHALQAESAELEATVARQQERLRSEIGSRDAALREFQERLDQEIAECRRLAHAADAAAELAALKAMVSELTRHVALEAEARRAADAVAREAEARLVAAECDNVAVRDDGARPGLNWRRCKGASLAMRRPSAKSRAGVPTCAADAFSMSAGGPVKSTICGGWWKNATAPSFIMTAASRKAWGVLPGC